MRKKFIKDRQKEFNRIKKYMEEDPKIKRIDLYQHLYGDFGHMLYMEFPRAAKTADVKAGIKRGIKSSSKTLHYKCTRKKGKPRCKLYKTYKGGHTAKHWNE